MTTCEQCGRPNPQFAVGRSSSRVASDRLLIYEGYAEHPFTYERHPKCLACRHGTKSQLKHQPQGEALKAWLIKVNERR